MSSFISICVSVKHNMSLSNKCFSSKMSLKCVLNERVFNNDIAMAHSVTLFCVCDLKQLSFLNLSYFLFADSPIKYNSLMLVILLNATYICPWLKNFWDSKSKLTTPSVKLYKLYKHMAVLNEIVFFWQMVVACSLTKTKQYSTLLYWYPVI